MDTFVLYNDTLLLVYNLVDDCYELAFDHGSGFPYEFYEEITDEGVSFYLLYMEDKAMYPTSSYDRWMEYEDVVPFLESYQSKTKTGVQKTRRLIEQYNVLKNAINS